jgi:uncharacterized circularly permuted ATP-grasp superfamily protein/uncharacterized alpha-E superfamily protein
MTTLEAGHLPEWIASLPDLSRRQLDADRLLAAEGAGHIVHDLPVRSDGRVVALESRPWRLDPIPLVLDATEFVALADAAVARMRMLESILGDLYGARSLLGDAVVDPVLLWGSARYRLAAFGPHPPRRWMTNYAVDVIRDVGGRWHAVQDLTDAPPGVGYALLGRMVTSRVHRDLIARLPLGRALRSLDPFADQLRDGLADVAAVADPRIVVLSGGVDHPSFVEQSYLATRLGLNLAEGADLVVRQRRVWLRSLAGLEPVDVLFRRLEDDQIDPMEVNASGGVGIPGVLLAARSGGVALANAHGCGVLEDPALAEQWDLAGDWLTGHTSDYQGAAPLRRISAADRASTRWDVHPAWEEGRLVERAVTLRLHLVASNQGIDVLQGGSARVLADGDDPTVPTAASAKDVWVIGGTVAPPAVRRREPLRQVDLIASVPTRAAEALFWAGRSLERAELIARSLEVVLDRTTGVVDAEIADPWVIPAVEMVARIAGVTARLSDGPGRSVHALTLALGALTDQLGILLAEASSVRDFFSVTAGRVFARLADTRAQLRTLLDLDVSGPRVDIAGIDSRLLQTVLIDIASVVGLWNESVVHGPAWRFGEIGRRIERAFGVIDGVQGAFGMLDATRPASQPWLFAPVAADADHLDHPVDHRADYERQRVIEVVLATNESLVAYRRRHRSDVEFRLAMHLVVADVHNPRAAAAALEAVRYQAEQLEWDEGSAAAADLLVSLSQTPFDTVQSTAVALGELWRACDRLARDVVGVHLVAPVDPRVMGGS